MKELKAILRTKSGRRLAVVSVIIFLIITAVVFYATFKLCENIHQKQMNNDLSEIQRIIDSSRNELAMRSRIYEEDVLTRAELGMKIYAEESEKTDAEKLRQIRSAVSAASVSLVDEQRKILFTTGVVSPEESFSACLQTLEPGQFYMDVYTTPAGEGEETDHQESMSLMMLPVDGNSKRNVVFEFPCDTVLDFYNTINEWPSMLERILFSRDTAAFVKVGDRIESYALDTLSSGEAQRVRADLNRVFQNSDRFRGRAGESRTRLISLAGRRYLATMMHDSGENADLLLTIPLQNVFRNGVFIAVAISALVGLGIVLIQIYIYRCVLRAKARKRIQGVSIGWICRVTWPGLLTILVVPVFFASMLLMLESRTNAAFFSANNRASIQNEVEWRKNQENKIRVTFMDIYQKRAQTIAAYLAEHPEEQTREGLEELSRIARSEYLMRFDKDGQETVSSNSYTGFAVGKNLGDQYQSVLMGYPSAMIGPEADPYTNQMQISSAILMTDGGGTPDGFLLAVFSAGDLNAEMNRMKLENTVNQFIVQENHVAAAVNDADGLFIAHTDPKMIGLKAANYLEDFEPGNSYEGFTEYNGKNVYLSASSSNGRTILFMVPGQGDLYARKVFALMLLGMLLILLLYYPIAGLLSARSVWNAKEDIPVSASSGKPMMVFYNGFVVFLTLFALLTMIAYANGWWTTFDFVFSEQWTKGLHLFSFWAALFTLVITLFVLLVIQTVLNLVEKRLSLRTKTITRLASSLITYLAIIFLAFWILNMFGVNTTALVASAGVISIAVGMGAQSMAADLLAGFFMMLEGSVHVGDQVNVGGVSGTVTDMGIRTTEITDRDGNVVVLNNSKVTGVTNKSRHRAEPEPQPAPEANHESETKQDSKQEPEKGSEPAAKPESGPTPQKDNKPEAGPAPKPETQTEPKKKQKPRLKA